MNYELLDSGENQKLELLGNYKIIRQSLVSPYSRTSPELWKNPDAVYERSASGGGEWKFKKNPPKDLVLEFDGLFAKVKLTPFGHIGVFPEQQNNWNIIKKIGENNSNFEVMNLFAYSGLSTLACLYSGMKVCHLDSSRGMVEWARENAEVSKLSDRSVRWMIEDVKKFIKREIKRNKHYNGFIMDPPSFGRGSQGEVWKIEEDLIPLIDDLMQLCNHKPDFIILSCHTGGFSPLVLERILYSRIKQDGTFRSTELSIPERSGKLLSGGFCAYYFSKKTGIGKEDF